MKGEEHQQHPSTPEPKDGDQSDHPDGSATSQDEDEARSNDEQAQKKQDEDLMSGAESPA